MRRYLVLSVLVLLFLSPLALCQPELPDMGDDMFELEGAEGFGSSFGLYSPLLSSKQSAPVITKSAPIVAKAPRVTMRAVPYTYTKPVTHLESVAVPTKQIIDDEVLTFEQVPVQQGKKGYSGGYGGGGGYGGFGVAQGGYQGNGLWQGPGGLWPGVGFGQSACQLHSHVPHTDSTTRWHSPAPSIDSIVLALWQARLAASAGVRWVH
ncbi:hypothetical protein MMC34_008257 [Xylographa carneopallida]|nr:hypothetical protein [Xylographa carneopallida]